MASETKREREGQWGGGEKGGLAEVSRLWSQLAQRNDEQHTAIPIRLLPVCLQHTGASTICHCRQLDRPHASKHFNTAQPTSSQGSDHGHEAARIRHVWRRTNQSALPFRFVRYDVANNDWNPVGNKHHACCLRIEKGKNDFDTSTGFQPVWGGERETYKWKEKTNNEWLQAK